MFNTDEELLTILRNVVEAIQNQYEYHDASYTKEDQACEARRTVEKVLIKLVKDANEIC